MIFIQEAKSNKNINQISGGNFYCTTLSPLFSTLFYGNRCLYALTKVDQTDLFAGPVIQASVTIALYKGFFG
ncbi:MAG TPA: hypothetical protein DD675_19930 [Raoultella ornithinolytica]|nr:hypothetical protein [Raoultella ornithinolytica]